MENSRVLWIAGLLCGTLLAGAWTARGATYFVATNGSDFNSGTSIGSPFLTVSKAASVVNAGDTVNIRGGTYRETVTFSRSGTPASQITFQNFSNEVVTISGADVIATNFWSVYSNNIWRAPMSWTLGDGKDQVFVDGQAMNMARWPNSSLDLSHPVLATVDGVSIPNQSDAVVTLNDSTLTQPANFWAGARLNIGGGAVWVCKTFTVTNSTPGSLIFYGGNQTNSNYRPTTGNPYFIWGTLNALDAGGEWHLDTGAQMLYLWTPAGDAPANHLVEAKRRTYAFDFNSRSNIVVRGVRMFGATVNMGSSSRGNTIDGVEARYVSQFTVITATFSTGTSDTGFLINGTSNRVLNSIVAWSAGNGVMLAGAGHTVSNCVIHDVDYTANNPGAIYMNGSGHLVVRNTLYNSGRSVLLPYVGSSRILNNHVFNAGLQMQDLGCLYTYGKDGAGTEIAYNIFHGAQPVYANKTAVGLYLDNSSRNFRVHHNLCYDAPRAFQSNLPGTNHLIYNNTFLGDVHSIRGNGTPSDGSGTGFKNNIFRNATNTYTGANATFANNLPQTIDPLFVSVTDGDYGLKTNSPATDAGLVVSPYTDGYLGAAPDLGAFEYGAPPWTAGSFLTIGGFYEADVGGARPPGGLDLWNGRYTLQGGGGDIWSTNDQCHFSYIPVTNNHFQVVARVTSLLSPIDSIHSAMKCGVMIRESLAAASRHATTAITPGLGVMQLYRNATGGISVSSKVDGKIAPIWIKVVRDGNAFTSYYSDDGTGWTQIGVPQTIVLPDAVYAGLCLSSHTSGSVAVATIESPGVEDLTGLRPLITGLTVNGGTLSITATAGAPGAQWTLLQSTDLMPLNLWQTSSIVTFDANGNLAANILNAATNPHMFYILKR